MTMANFSSVTTAGFWYKTHNVGYKVVWKSTRIPYSWNAFTLTLTDDACESGWSRSNTSTYADPPTTYNTL